MKEFYILNSKAEYFSGMMYGGEFVWCVDVKEAKTFNEESKFIGLQRYCPLETLYKVEVDKSQDGYEFGKKRKKEVKSKVDIKKKIEGLKKKIEKNPNWTVPLNGVKVTATQALEYYNKMI